MKHASWVACVHSHDRARLRLLCFPYAAGSASTYRFLARVLPDTLLEALEIWAVEYPGHGERSGEAPYSAFPALADGLTDAVAPLFTPETALFGYSLGAMLGFEVARRLRDHTGEGPSALFVAACGAPQLTIAGPDVASSPEALAAYLGQQAAVTADAREIAQCWPWFQAVFGLRRTYCYPSGQPLACPITAFGGADDDDVSEEALRGWREQTTLRGSFSYHLLPGQRHLFLKQPLFLRLLTRSLLAWVFFAEQTESYWPNGAKA